MSGKCIAEASLGSKRKLSPKTKHNYELSSVKLTYILAISTMMTTPIELVC